LGPFSADFSLTYDSEVLWMSRSTTTRGESAESGSDELIANDKYRPA
jgi:hypothetical protein